MLACTLKFNTIVPLFSSMTNGALSSEIWEPIASRLPSTIVNVKVSASSMSLACKVFNIVEVETSEKFDCAYRKCNYCGLQSG